MKITESHSYGKNTIRGGFADAAAALAWIEAAQGIVQAEEDTDYPGYYDIFTKHGRVLAIEPEA